MNSIVDSMQLVKFYCSFILFLISFSLFSIEEEPPSFREIRLENGMVICLKPTSFEEERVFFQLFAMGGHSSLSATDRPSAILAPEIVWEAGFDGRSGDQVDFALYEKSIEMDVKIRPFDRQIEGNCPTESFEESLKTINAFFTKASFDRDSFKKALEAARSQLKSKEFQSQMGAEEAFLKVNTQDWDVLYPLSVAQLDYVSLIKAQSFFKKCFSNPKDFVLVVVGDFDPSEVEHLIKAYLGTIPASSIAGPINAVCPSFPEGKMKKDLKGFSRYKKTITRLTYPLSVYITQGKTDRLDVVCQLIKKRLANSLQTKYPSKTKLEVNYQFPFFPLLDATWMTIQFESSEQEAQAFVEDLLKELNKLHEEGSSAKEMESIQMTQHDSFTIEDNSYLLSLLSNYYRWKWDLSLLDKKEKDHPSTEKEIVKNDLKRYLKLDHYTIISLHP